ncbi:hypothetical protein Tco_1314815 [Tanacetum coccineum]
MDHIRRNQNKKADALSKLASMTFEYLTKEAKNVIQEIQKGSCRFNAEPRSMVVKVTKQGPLPTDSGNLKFLAIAVEHFTKWIEANPLNAVNERQIRQSFCPITEHVEIMNYVENQPVRSQQGWVDDLPQILWVHRNNQKETPFTLTYGSEAIISKVMNLTSEKEESVTQKRDERKGNKERKVALIEEAYYQNKLRRHHNTKNRCSTFSLGDFVWLSGHSEDNHKQVQKGPYIISGAYERGLYKITDAFDHSLVHTMRGSSIAWASLELNGGETLAS